MFFFYDSTLSVFLHNGAFCNETMLALSIFLPVSVVAFAFLLFSLTVLHATYSQLRTPLNVIFLLGKRGRNVHICFYNLDFGDVAQWLAVLTMSENTHCNNPELLVKTLLCTAFQSENRIEGLSV
jgi:hypothetical protein